MDRLDESDGWQQASSGAEEVQCTSPACWLPSSNQHAWWADHPFCNILFGSIPAHTLVFFYEKFKRITIYCFRADSWYWPILRGCGRGGNCWVPTIGASFLTHQLLAAQLPTLGRKELGTTHCLELPTGQTRVALNWHTGVGGGGGGVLGCTTCLPFYSLLVLLLSYPYNLKLSTDACNNPCPCVSQLFSIWSILHLSRE